MLLPVALAQQTPPPERGVVVSYEDSAPSAESPRPYVVIGTTTVALSDDGKAPDPVEGDGAWAGHTRVVTDTPLSVALHHGSVEAEPVLRDTLTLASTDAALQIRFRHDAAGYSVTTEGVVEGTTSRAPKPASEPRSWVLPIAALGAIAVAGGLVVALRPRASAPLVALAEPVGTGRPFGLPGLDEGGVAWVCPDGCDLLPSIVRELATWGHVVVLPRAASRAALGALPFGPTWRFAEDRPDPLDVAAATRRLGRAGLLVEGPDALEAPTRRERPAAVMEELLRKGGLPVLFLLRPHEPVPSGARVVRLEREGEELRADQARLVRREDGWYRA